MEFVNEQNFALVHDITKIHPLTVALFYAGDLKVNVLLINRINQLEYSLISKYLEYSIVRSAVILLSKIKHCYFSFDSNNISYSSVIAPCSRCTVYLRIRCNFGGGKKSKQRKQYYINGNHSACFARFFFRDNIIKSRTRRP